MKTVILMAIIVFLPNHLIAQNAISIQVQNAKAGLSPDSLYQGYILGILTNDSTKPVIIKDKGFTNCYSRPGDFSIEILNDPNVRGANIEEFSVCSFVGPFYDTIFPKQNKIFQLPIVLVRLRPNMKLMARLTFAIGDLSEQNRDNWTCYKSNIFVINSEKSTSCADLVHSMIK